MGLGILLKQSYTSTADIKDSTHTTFRAGIQTTGRSCLAGGICVSGFLIQICKAGHFQALLIWTDCKCWGADTWLPLLRCRGSFLQLVGRVVLLLSVGEKRLIQFYESAGIIKGLRIDAVTKARRCLDLSGYVAMAIKKNALI